MTRGAIKCLTALLFSIGSVRAAAIDDIVGIFGGASLASIYTRFPAFIDSVIYLVLFIGLAQFVFKKRGKEFKLVAIALGIALAVGMSYFSYRAEFNLGKIGAIPALVLLIMLGTLLYNILQEAFKDKKAAGALAYLIIHSLFLTSFSKLTEWFPPLILSIMAILSLAALIVLIISIVGLFKGKGNHDETSSPPDLPNARNITPANPTPSSTPTNITPSNTTGTSPTTPAGTPPGSPPPFRPPLTPPPPTPRRRIASDPPTPPGGGPPGVIDGPEPNVPVVPKEPPISDEQEYKYDLSPGFGPIRSQGNLGACTGFAGTATFEYMLTNHNKLPARPLSPLYQYYKSRELTGTTARDVGAPTQAIPVVLQQTGVCYEELWTYQDKITNKWSQPPPPEANRDAELKRLVNVHRVVKSDPDQWVYALASNYPLLIAVTWPTDVPNNVPFYHNPNPKPSGGHAMVIVGYHSHYPVNQNGRMVGVKAFKIRNSWDVTWGENGYIWISAETLKKIIKYDPLILHGHQGKSSKSTFKILGRFVPHDGITADMNGEQIFNRNFPPLDNKTDLTVAALAQIGGELRFIGTDQQIDHAGKFSLTIDQDPATFQPFTNLRKAFAQFSDSQFSKVDAGVIVVVKPKESDPASWYFHIVDFKYSIAGRGGEGYRDARNPRSNKEDQRRSYSGKPISFSAEHNTEINVIVPKFDYNKLQK